MDISRIEEEFRRIKKMGFIPNVKSDLNDGSAGNTFEEYLGVKENNLKEPDFENFEIKTKKNYLKSKSPISLFTLKPSHPADGDSYMRKNWGVPDSRYKNVLRFSTSLYAHKWSVVYKKNKYKIDIDKKNKRIFIVQADLNEKVTDRNVYWNFDDIHNGARKLENLLLVEADVKNVNNKLYFHYTSASVYYDYLGNQNFIDLLESGLIRYDNRLGVYGPTTPHAGKPHNHGGGFRLDRKNINLLYRNVIELQ